MKELYLWYLLIYLYYIYQNIGLLNNNEIYKLLEIDNNIYIIMLKKYFI
jgi:hypothetical protein